MSCAFPDVRGKDIMVSDAARNKSIEGEAMWSQ